ncbi:unnamed protein product, partial [Staurois parvus]
MTLGRKGLTSGAIKGLTVCCFTVYCVCGLLCQHIALYCCAMQSNTKHCAKADRKRSVLFTYRARKCKI